MKTKVSFTIGEVTASLEVEEGPSLSFPPQEPKASTVIDEAFAKVILIVKNEVYGENWQPPSPR